jgi:hypothetical protein
VLQYRILHEAHGKDGGLFAEVVIFVDRAVLRHLAPSAAPLHKG